MVHERCSKKTSLSGPLNRDTDKYLIEGMSTPWDFPWEWSSFNQNHSKNEWSSIYITVPVPCTGDLMVSRVHCPHFRGTSCLDGDRVAINQQTEKCWEGRAQVAVSHKRRGSQSSWVVTEGFFEEGIQTERQQKGWNGQKWIGLWRKTRDHGYQEPGRIVRKNLQWQKQLEHQLHMSNRKFSISCCHRILENGRSDRYEVSLVAQQQRIHLPMQET